MKTLTATIALILLTNSVAMSQWKKQDGTPIENTADRKSVGPFGGNLLIVKDPRGFIEEWKKPETPHINPATTTQRGELLGAIILFAGCKADAQGACNTEVDYSFYRPDGSLYAEQKAQPLWKDEAPPPPIIQLGQAILAIRFEKDDPAGEYKIKAKVSDLNAKITFDLETKIRLQ
jgi:hypothetical protein